MFYIGKHLIKNPYILAPMAGVSQMPFRKLALKMGAGLAPTELISAKGLFYESVRTKTYLIHDRIERPFCVQLFGGEVEAMATAARKAYEMGADIIDINMGCPVKKVTKINAGSALLCDQERAASMVQAMLKATDHRIPITAKIRSGWDQNNLNYIEVGLALADAGISAIALHARTRAQAYSGKACLEHIARLKSALKIPVIGNGDVQNKADARFMFEQTKCDAVMIGRGALGNPWIFESMLADQAKILNSHERYSVIKEHLNDHFKLHEEISQCSNQKFDAMAAIRSFRSHLIWYSKGLKDGALFRQSIMTKETAAASLDLIDEYFQQASSAHGADREYEDGIDYRQAFG